MWLCAYLVCNDPLFLPFWCFKPSLHPWRMRVVFSAGIQSIIASGDGK